MVQKIKMEKSISAAIVTHSRSEFDVIAVEYDVLSADMILWRPDFTVVTDRNSSFPNSLGDGIDRDIGLSATDDIHNALSSWYYDQYGDDLTSVDGCSLGTVFESSTELLFYNVAQCYLEFDRLHGCYDTVLVDSLGDPVKEFVTKWFQEQGCHQFKIVRSYKHKKKYSVSVHPMNLLRDLEYALRGSSLDSVIGWLIRKLQPIKTKTVFIFDAAKFEDYLCRKKEDRFSNISILTPIRRQLRTIRGNSIFWKRTKIKPHTELKMIAMNANSKGWRLDTNVIPIDLLQSAVQQFVIPHWPSAMSYFNSYLNVFRDFKIRLAVFCTDGTELALLGAYAAKTLGIPTVVMPHGIAPWTHSSLIKQSKGLFDTYYSIGKYDTLKFKECGLAVSSIEDIKLPWFSNRSFCSYSRKVKSSSIQKAMLLPLDTGFSLSFSASDIMVHIKEMIEACEFCGVEVHGIKFRSAREVRSFGLVVGENEIFGRNTFVYAGYGSLSDYFEDIDLVIGPFNSATAECAISRIPYYCYQDCSIYVKNPNIFYHLAQSISHIASSPEELEKNLTQGKIFQDKYDAQSLVATDESFLGACRDLDKLFEENFN